MKPDPKEIPGRMSDRVVLCMSRLSNMLPVKNAPGGRSLDMIIYSFARLFASLVPLGLSCHT